MPDRHFDFEINNLDDVTEHLDSLWYELNELINAVSSRAPCTNPPDTCGFQGGEQQQKRAGKKGYAKYPVKKTKR
jgi:hypothetical protein